MARPTKYMPEFVQLALNYCKLGATDAQLAEFLGVVESTINEWKLEYPEFSESISTGKDIFDVKRVEGALIHSALGFSHPSEKIFMHEGEVIRADTVEQYPPNAASLIFFLKNRDKARWKDRQEHEHTGKDGAQLIPVINVGSKKD